MFLFHLMLMKQKNLRISLSGVTFIDVSELLYKVEFSSTPGIDSVIT